MGRRSILAALAIFGGTAVSALPVPDGTYEQGACTGEEASDGRVTVSGESVAFWESTCQATNPTNVRDMGGAVLYDMVCSGEGETWTRRMMLMQGPEGRLVIVRAGFASTYARCD